MSTLPFKINFFKQVEDFFLLRQLDKQYDLMIDKYFSNKENKKEMNRSLEEKGKRGFNLNWPSWEVEKKILRWTFLNHKHLSSPITKKMLKVDNPFVQTEFLKDINTNVSEIISIGENHIIGNLIVRGFADSCKDSSGCIINQKGLSIGLLISNSYKFAKDKMISKKEPIYYQRLIAQKHKIFGHWLLYIASLFIITYSIFFLCLNIINMIGVLDDIKLFFNFLSFLNLYIFIFFLIPVIFFLVSLVLILIPSKNKK